MSYKSCGDCRYHYKEENGFIHSCTLDGHRLEVENLIHSCCEKYEKRPPTNYEKITESIESLAEFIKLVSACQHMSCSKCPLDGINCSSAIGIKEWLQEESDNEV